TYLHASEPAIALAFSAECIVTRDVAPALLEQAGRTHQMSLEAIAIHVLAECQETLTLSWSITPLTPDVDEASCFARSRRSALSTVPDKVTVPSLVSTLICSDLSPGSARMADF